MLPTSTTADEFMLDSVERSVEWPEATLATTFQPIACPVCTACGFSAEECDKAHRQNRSAR